MTSRITVAALVIYTMTLSAKQTLPRDGGVGAQSIGTGVIAGVLMNKDAPPTPVRRALLTLSGSALRFDVMTSTDETGRFAFAGLPAGRFVLSASKTGYVRDSYGSQQPGSAGSPIVLGSGERTNLTMALTRGAVIAGTVRLPDGAPTSSVRLQLLKYELVNGERRLVSARGGAYGVGDDGAYRLSGLAAGEYVVAVSIWNTGADEIRLADMSLSPQAPMPSVGFAPTFYPAEVDASRAAPIAVQAGEERTGIDVTLKFVPASRLTGIMLDNEGKPPSTVQASLVEGSGVQRPAIAVQPDRNGRFSVTGLSPGRYQLTARAAPAGAAPQAAGARGGSPPLPLWANHEFTIDGRDQSDVAITLQPGRTVSGQITFEPGATPAPTGLSQFQVLLENPQARVGQQPVAWGFANDDGTFVLSGVPPGRYRFRLQFAPGIRAFSGWTLRSATVKDRDILDELVVIEPERDLSGIAVRYTDRGAELSGHLLDRTGAPAPEFFVVAFSTDRKYWTDGSRRTISFRPARDGSFSWIGVPPGEYYLAAVTRLEGGQLGDAAFLQSLIPTSARIAIAEGEKKQQDLRIGG